jgi:ABC-type uncharacterized transport system auxiliary subunit
MRTFFGLFFCFFLFGCSIIDTEPYKKVYYFDIGSPAVKYEIKTKHVGAVSVNAASPYFEKMVFRFSPNRVEFDEYNRWSSMPADILQHYIVMACIRDSNTDDAKLVLRVEIFRFEMDMQKKSAVCDLVFRIENTENGSSIWQNLYHQEVPVSALTAEAFAGAMQSAVDNVLKQFITDIQSVK